MNSRTRTLLATLGGLAALWVAWGAYVARTTERVPYETVDRFDGVELRHYPQAVLVETTASDPGTAFRRLFRYITGANEGREEVAMTAPVASRGEAIPMTAPVRTLRAGEDVPMTAPVRTEGDDGAVTMAFYLPAEYAPETAPVPTDTSVRLVVEPARTVAVRRFSWYATDGRVARERRSLLDELAARGIETSDAPALLQYNDPWTPPFMRTNEVAVTVREPAV
ncbi:SOUL family heme-binding protein [Halobacteriaceae archaeon GCM10025711]